MCSISPRRTLRGWDAVSHRGGTEGSGHTARVNPLLLVSSMSVGRGLGLPEAVSSLITQDK